MIYKSAGFRNLPANAFVTLGWLLNEISGRSQDSNGLVLFERRLCMQYFEGIADQIESRVICSPSSCYFVLPKSINPFVPVKHDVLELLQG